MSRILAWVVAADGRNLRIAPALLFAAAALLQPVSEARADLSPQAKEVLEAVEKVAPTVEEIGQKLWDLSEVSLLETKSSAYLKDLLKDNGFSITSEGTAGVPTAFIAEYGSGEPKLGILLEYDALPDLANAAVPRKQPREDGVTAGHGCGHNLIGAGAIGAALATKALMGEQQVSGTLRLYGAAAEETEGAKVFMAREGVFDDLDAMLHMHALDRPRVAKVRLAASQQLFVEFKGKKSHAGMAPWNGRSALDGVEVLLHSVNMMREHVEPTARIHYVIKDGGGETTNTVPAYASVLLTYRDIDRAHVKQGIEWIKAMVEGAALATQTEGLAVEYFGTHDLLPNTPLAERMQEHYEAVGLPELTQKEIAFAKELQKAVGLEPKGMATEVDPLPDEPTRGGLTDVGDVSYITPTMGITAPSLPLGVGLHTWMATASNGTSMAYKAAVTAAKILVLTGMDILTDAEFLEQVKADFEKRTEGFTYASPIPDFIKEPSGLPDEMRSFDTHVELKARILKTTEDHWFGDHPHEE
jgi:aminobenzoyl-glutamate utilization protein B